MELKALSLHKRSRLRRGLTYLDFNVNYVRDRQAKLQLACRTYGRSLKAKGLELLVAHHKLCNHKLGLSIRVQEFTESSHARFALRHGFKGLRDNWHLARWLQIEQQACYEFMLRRGYNRFVEGCQTEIDFSLAAARQWRLAKVMRKAIDALVDNMHLRAEAKERDEGAKDYYQLDVLLPQTFKAWKVYTVTKLRKAKKQQRATQLFNHKTFEKSFKGWLAQIQAIQSHQLADHNAGNMHAKRLKRSVLNQWLDFTDLKRLSALARQHRGDCIVRQALRVWSDEMRAKHNLTELRLQFEKFLTKRRLKHGFEELLELKQSTQQLRRKAALAHRYRQRKLKLRVFDAYQKHVTEHWSSIGKIRAGKVASKELTCRRVLRGLSLVAIKRRRIEALEGKVTVDVEGRLVTNAFYNWKGLYDRASQGRREEAALLTNAQTALHAGRAKRAIKRLQNYQKSRQAKRKRNLEAEAAYNNNLLRLAWSRLKLSLAKRKAKAAKEAVGTSHYADSLKRLAMGKLVDYLEEKQETRYMYITALKTWSLALYKRVWKGWALYAKAKAEKARKEASALELRKLDMVKQAVSSWVRVGIEWRTMREVAIREQLLLVEERKRKLVRKFARRWLEATVRKKKRNPPKPVFEARQKLVVRDVDEVRRKRSPPRHLDTTYTRSSPLKRASGDTSQFNLLRKRTAPRPLYSQAHAPLHSQAHAPLQSQSHAKSSTFNLTHLDPTNSTAYIPSRRPNPLEAPLVYSWQRLKK